MADDIKRMRYFNGLFLKEDEFRLDQDYHIRMRRLHNLSQYTWGILWGLEVNAGPGNQEITVTKGIALNKITLNGEEVRQEIVILNDAVVDLSTYGGSKNVYVYISYSEVETDLDTEKGGDEKIHWLEKAAIGHSETEPVDKQENIILAKVAIKSDGTIDAAGILYKEEDGGNLLRTYASLTVEGGMHVGGSSNPGNKSLLVDGNCTINGDLVVQGETTTVNTQNLEVEDNIIRVNKYDEQSSPIEINGGLEVFRGGTAKNAQIVWDEADDKWKIGLEGNLLDIAYGADWDALTNNSIADALHTHSKLVSGDGSVDPALNVDNAGNVGIGTETPSKKLEVDGAVKAKSFLGTDAQLTGNIGVKGNIEIGGSLGVNGTVKATSFKGDGSGLTGISAGKWADGPEKGIYYNAGNVGIGTSTPSEKLDVDGAVKAKSFLGADAKLGSLVVKGNVELGGSLRVKGTVEATSFEGDGSGLTGISTGKWADGPEKGIYYNSGNVGIGTNEPVSWAKLDVAGRIRSKNTRSQVSANNHVKTDSPSWVALPNMSIKITTGNNPVFITFKTGGTQIEGEADGGRARFRLLVDGVQKAFTLHEFHNNGWELRDITLNWLETLSEGRHKIEVQWNAEKGTLTTCWYNDTRNLIVVEL